MRHLLIKKWLIFILSRLGADFALRNSLFEAVVLTKNAYPD